MSRMVMCRKLGKELPALDFPPFPGDKGMEVYNTVSKQAWQDWLREQTMLINENHLNVMDPAARVFLDEQRANYFAGEGYVRPKGWVPEK